MDTSSLKLNDFESFENFLFSEEERKLPEDEKWKKYVISDNTRILAKHYFIAPIPTSELKRIEEYQLCHYAYWMCISIFTPMSKMNFWTENNKIPSGRCYACAYANTCSTGCTSCPLQNHIFDCIPPYIDWGEYYSTNACAACAIKIATWPWVKETKR